MGLCTFQARRPQGIWQCRRRRQGQQGGTLSTLEVGRGESEFWPKNGSYPKKSPKMTFPPLIIWAKATFFFEQLFPVVARTWLGEKSGTSFFGPKFQFLAKKSDFCHTTPIFVDDPFLALDMTVNFPPLLLRSFPFSVQCNCAVFKAHHPCIPFLM